MTTTDHRPTTAPAAETGVPSSVRPPRNTQRGWFGQFLLRLHFYAGLFIGPFILIAALSGAVYALGPTIEQGEADLMVIVSSKYVFVDAAAACAGRVRLSWRR